MKIVNKTHWNGRDLRRLVIAVANREIDKEHKERLKVTVEYQRGVRGKLGYAYYNDHRIWIHLPRHGDVDSGTNGEGYRP